MQGKHRDRLGAFAARNLLKPKAFEAGEYCFGAHAMKLAALASVSLLLFSTPSLAADLGPYYSEREAYVERRAPPAVVEQRIVEHHYYVPREEVVVVPRYYTPYAYRDDVYYGYGYRYPRPAYFFGGPYWRHHHHW